jgi:hypothetical protein
MNLLIYKVLSLTLPMRKKYFIHFAITVLLVLLSSFGWYSSQLMPDIFTSGLCLIIFIVLVEKKLTIFSAVLYLTTFFFFLISHFSNIAISILFILTYLSLILFKSDVFVNRKTAFKRLILLTTGIICSVLFLMFNHYYHGKGFRMTLTSNIFLAARLAEDGILKKYLDENCGKKIDNILCDSAHLLNPSVNDFLWADKSFMRSLGYRMPEWEKADTIFAPAVHDILKTPRYLKLYIWENIKGTCRQLFRLDIGQGVVSYKVNSAPYYPIKYHLKNEVEEFLHTVQCWGMLNFNIINLINYFVLGLSVIIIFWGCYYKKINKKIILLIVTAGLCYFYNAAVTSSISGVSTRYQARVSWLLVFIALIIVFLVSARIKELLTEMTGAK